MKYGFFILLLFAQVLQAEVYKTVNEDGEVIFSDVRSEGAEAVELPGLTTYKPPPLTRTPARRGASGETGDGSSYASLEVSSPLDDATIRDNQGNVTIALALEPELLTRSGHRIQYFLDGMPDGDPETGLTHTYRNVDRGTHNLSAAVVDVDGLEIIRTAPVTIHLHRISKLTSPAFRNNASGN